VYKITSRKMMSSRLMAASWVMTSLHMGRGSWVMALSSFHLTNLTICHVGINIHKYTWAARESQSIIDYVIVNDKLKSQVLDTRAYRGP
jgi:hypothetical protein